MKFYTVYKTTNNINGKYYIGVHKTSNPYDDYLGSGKFLKRAIEKYGIENFEKEILAIFETAKEAFDLEKELITFEMIESNQVYNLKNGGEGGFDFINKNKFNLYGKNGKEEHGLENLLNASKIHRIRMKEDEEYRLDYCKKVSEGCRKRFENGGKGSFLGKKHTTETKLKIGEKISLIQSGEKNSQYGTCWITKDNENKKIKKEELDFWLQQGWKKGRKTL